MKGVAIVMDISRLRERKNAVIGLVRKACRNAHGLNRDAVRCRRALSRENERMSTERRWGVKDKKPTVGIEVINEILKRDPCARATSSPELFRSRNCLPRNRSGTANSASF